VIPAEFDYHRATTVDEALTLMQQYGEEAKLLAGGHSLLPAMKLRFNTCTHLIDIGRLKELHYIREVGGDLAIGANTTHAEIAVSNLVQQKAAALAQAAAVIGDPQVRNMGTLGGSLAHADPAADYPAAVLALDATIHVKGPEGERTITAMDFFQDLYLTELDEEEIITEVRFPITDHPSAYLKFPHPASRFAVVGCAAKLTDSGARVAFTGIANAAFRDENVEDALEGKPLNAATIAEAAAQATDGEELLADLFAGANYRRHLARVFAKRTLLKAAGIE